MPDAPIATPTHDIAVVVATRGRPDGVVRTVRSLLRSDDPHLRVLVVDQSEDADRVRVIHEIGSEPRVTIIAAQPIGLAAARNIGVTYAGSTIVAFTDDDCEVGPGWVDDVATAFATDARIGVVLGEVRAVQHDRKAGCIPSYTISIPLLVTSPEHKARAEGMGACMAIRRATWDAVGGFDELFGAGAPLRSAEDSDFVMRALHAGHWVYETPLVSVTHLGFRAWRDVPSLIEGYMVGLGAANAKSLRRSGRHALQPIFSLAWRWLVGQPVIDLGHRPSRRLRLRAFLRGARHGLSLPIDPRTGLFRRADRFQHAQFVAIPATPTSIRSRIDKVD